MIMARNSSLIFWLITLLNCQQCCSICDKDFTSDGKEFIFGYMQNHGSSRNPYIAVTTQFNGVHVNVSTPLCCNGDIQQTILQSGEMEFIDLPTEVLGSGNSKMNEGVYVTSDAAISITAVNGQKMSMDSTLILPVRSLGKTYVIGTWKKDPELLIVATKDGTSIEITFSSNNSDISVSYNDNTYKSGSTLSENLNRFQTLHIQQTDSDADLSGTFITASEPISVFSGNKKVLVEATLNGNTKDHLWEQIPPITSLGKSYLTVPTPGKIDGDFYRVIASKASTTVKIRNEEYYLAQVGDCYTIDVASDEHVFITSDKPILLIMFSKTGSTLGDPLMMVIPALDQFSTNFVFKALDESYLFNFIVILAHNITGISLDGSTIPSAAWTAISAGNQSWFFYEYTTSDQIHSVETQDSSTTFFAAAFGNKQKESYGYTNGYKSCLRTEKKYTMNCVIEPVNGSILTEYYINCTSSLPGNVSLYITKENGFQLYTFSTEGLNGPMYLPQGTKEQNYTQSIYIKAGNIQNEECQTSVNVQVNPLVNMETTGESSTVLNTVDNLLDDESNGTNMITELLNSGNTEGATQLLGSIADTLNSLDTVNITSDEANKKQQFRTTVVEVLSSIEIKSIESVQQVTEVLNDVTSAQQDLKSEAQEKAVNLYEDIAITFSGISNETTLNKVEASAQQIVTGVASLLDLQISFSEKSDDNMEKDVKVESTAVKIEQNTKKILSTVNIVADAMLHLKSTGDEPTIIDTETLTLHLEKAKANNLFGKKYQNSKQFNGKSITGSFVLPELNAFPTENSSMQLKTMFSPKNPYTWSVSSQEITSPVVDLQLKAIDESLNNLTLPVAIYLSNEDTNATAENHTIILKYMNSGGKVEPLDKEKSGLLLKLSVKPSAYIKITIHSQYPNLPLKFLYQPEKPSVDEVSEHGSVLNKTTDGFQVFIPPTQHLNDTLHAGIVPDFNDTQILLAAINDTQILKNKSLEQNVSAENCTIDKCTYEYSVALAIKTNYLSCVYWDVISQNWSTDGCQVAETSNEDTLHCICNHLTAFSGSFLVAPNFIDPFGDAELFLTFFDNPVIVCTVVLIWILYFGILGWARKADRNDTGKYGVVILDDNDSLNHYTYLVCVVTGWWRDAGTTANVYIQIQGTFGQCYKHHLISTLKCCFTSGSEDWFLLTTSQTLGDLQSIDIWHDNNGHSPAWYLKQVFVKDMQSDEHWTFLCDMWLAVDRGLITTHISLPSVTVEELQQNKKKMFFLKSSKDIREGHLWISIFSKPPDNHFTRVQRLTCALSLLLLTMLTNLMFHGIPTGDPADQVQVGSFSLSLADIIIGIESALIMFPVNLLIVQIFMKTRPKPEILEKNITLSSKTGFSTKNDDSEALKTHTKISAGSPKGLPWWFIYIAWVLVISVSLIASYFVMLYGLSYGYTKSVEWLVSFLTSFFQSTLVSQPLKVFCIAFLVTLILKKPVELSPKTDGKHIDFHSRKDEKNSLWKRLKISKPVQQKDLQGIRNLIRLRQEMVDVIIYICLYFSFLCVILVIVHGHRDTKTCYHTTNALENTFFRPAFKKDPYSLNKIVTAELFWKYTDVKIIETLSKMKPLSDSNFLLLGAARLRQVRVKKDSCQYPQIITQNQFENTSCAASLWIGNHDPLSYNLSWSKEGEIDDTSPWSYQSAWKLKTIPYVANHATYPGGGYIISIPLNETRAKTVLDIYKAKGWLDDRTRGVFIEFTLYNANVNFFSVVMILFEFINTGGVHPYYQIFTTKLYHYTSDLEIFVAVCEVVFLLYTLIFSYRELQRFRILKCSQYFTDVWSYIEVIIIALSYTGIGLFFQRMISINSILNEYRLSSLDSFVSFYTAITWDAAMVYVMTFLVALYIFKSFKLLKFNRKLFLLSDTLAVARKDLSSFLFLIFIIFISFSHFAFITFGRHIPEYKDFATAIINLFNLALGVSNYFELEKANRILGPVFYVSFIFFVQWIFMTVFLAVVNIAIAISKRQICLKQNEFEIVDFMAEKINDLFSLRK